MIRTKTISVRAFDGRTVSLFYYYDYRDDNNNLHGGLGEYHQIPTLRLRRRPELPDPAAMPHDLQLRICSFLDTEDWLAFDSTCKGWKEIRQFLWLGDETTEQPPSWTMIRAEGSKNGRGEQRQAHNNHDNDLKKHSFAAANIEGKLNVGVTTMRTTTRMHVASCRCARRKLRKTWDKLRGFLPKQVTLNGPASEDDMDYLKELILPWSFPPAFLASWKLHDGEWDKSHGMYLGSRMLTIREIAAEIKASSEEAKNTGRAYSSYGGPILRIPLFSESRARQVAMELRLDFQRGTSTFQGDDYRDKDGRYPQDSGSYRSSASYKSNGEMSTQNGTIVLVSSLMPFVPRVKVLATSWEGFLTLV